MKVGGMPAVIALFARGTWELTDYVRFHGRTIDGRDHSTLGDAATSFSMGTVGLLLPFLPRSIHEWLNRPRR
jgi:hypothetical protein